MIQMKSKREVKKGQVLGFEVAVFATRLMFHGSPMFKRRAIHASLAMVSCLSLSAIAIFQPPIDAPVRSLVRPFSGS